MKTKKRKTNNRGFTPLEIKLTEGQKLPIFEINGNLVFKNRYPNLRSLTGFTLMEVMVAISIFAIALLGTLALMGQSMAFGKYANNRTIAQNEARRVFENVRRVADASGLATVASTNFNETLSDNTLKSGTIAVTDLSGNALTNNADPLPVRVTVSWSQKGQTLTYILDTMVTQR